MAPTSTSMRGSTPKGASRVCPGLGSCPRAPRGVPVSGGACDSLLSHRTPSFPCCCWASASTLLCLQAPPWPEPLQGRDFDLR